MTSLYCRIICLTILIQLCVTDIAPCDDYYVIFQEVGPLFKLLSTDRKDFTWDDITKASNNTIREECALYLDCMQFETNCQKKHFAKFYGIDERIDDKTESEKYATGNGKNITEPTETEQDILTDITTPIDEMNTTPSSMDINATSPVEDEPNTQHVQQVGPTVIEFDTNVNTTTEHTGIKINSTVSSNSTEQNEALIREKSATTKRNAAIIGGVLAGSLGSAAVIYFIGYKIQGLLQSATYNMPA